MKNIINLSFLGGAYEIGASCILVQAGNKNILMDCGIRQSSTKDVLPDFRTIQKKGGVDVIIVSHAHLDHIGSLPIISKEYPNAKIYANNMTKDLLRVLLYDSIKIMNNRESEIPLYAEADVINMLDKVLPINYQVEREILKDIKLTFYPAGHIAGASSVYLTTLDGSIFYSGDFSIFSQRTVDGAKIPKLRPDVAIFESTYGDKLHSNREVEEDRLIDIVRECIDNNGKMLIPAFALGRAQEVLLILKKALNTNKIKPVDVYVDGMVKDINRVYKYNPLFLKASLGKKVLKGIEPFYDDNIQAITTKEEREKILAKKDPCIIVSSSGMLTGGPSQYYAEKIASMDNGYIIITGYQDEESPGRQLLQLLDNTTEEKSLEINNKTIPLKCKIDRIGLSAHADKMEIKALLNTLSPKNIFFVHGEQSIIDNLSKEVQKEYFGRVYAPRCGESIDIKVGTPRKQHSKKLEYMMDEYDEITLDNIEKLWEFISMNYGNRFFTIEDLLFIWKGNSNISAKELDNLQELLYDSPYFENDLSRFFMFKARSKSDVQEGLKEKELKPNEITDLVNQYFGEYNFKKASLMFDTKTIVLNFDFPKIVSSDIYHVIKKFKSDSNWDVEINKSTNINMLDDLIKSFVDPSLIRKISHYLTEGKIAVNLHEANGDYAKDIEMFKARTGFELLLFTDSNELLKESSTKVFNPKNKTIMEQNQALNYIDTLFKVEEFKPYRKSIKGKNYIELSFITPIIGKRYTEKIQEISNRIGWSIGISNTVNQNEIIAIAKDLCSSNGIFLNKNPSFRPNDLRVLIIPNVLDENKLNKIKQQFDYRTGCSLEW